LFKKSETGFLTGIGVNQGNLEKKKENEKTVATEREVGEARVVEREKNDE